jgi:hypothetical protein
VGGPLLIFKLVLKKCGVNAHVVGGERIRDFVFEGFSPFLFLVLWVGFLECESAVLSGGSRSSLLSS